MAHQHWPDDDSIALHDEPQTTVRDHDPVTVGESPEARMSLVVRRLQDEAEGMARTAPNDAHALRRADPEALDRLRCVACAAESVALPDYLGALQEDPDLAALEASALQVGLGDEPDPGPYAELSSRDSPTSWAEAPDAADLRRKFSSRARRS